MDERSLRDILKRMGVTVVGRNGKWLQFSCPFARYSHRNGTDDNPSCGAMVNSEGVSCYKCLSCKKSGRISGLIRSLDHRNGTSRKSLALDADLADASVKFSGFEGEDEPDTDEMPPSLDEHVYTGMYGEAYDYIKARAYLKARGISKATAEHLELGYDVDERRIIFPVRHTDGRLYGFTGRSVLMEDKYPYAKYQKVRDYLGLPKRYLLLGSEFINPALPNFVVEGLFGYAHLWEIGADKYVNPLALMGSDPHIYKMELLRELNQLTILAVDNDEAGDACLYGPYDNDTGQHEGGGAIDLLCNHVPLVVPVWPKGKEDPDELTLAEVRRMVAAPLYKVAKKRIQYAKRA